MTQLLGLVLGLLLLATPAFAGEEILLWTGSVDATSYEVEMSTDMGVTWLPVAIIPTCAGVECQSPVAIEATAGLTLYRVISVRGTVRSVRHNAGLWLWPTAPDPSVPKPTSVGVR